ncbi:MAG: M20/M25/M40 family metallo-hydrolase [Bacteroidales bacterium]|nr:M20/M25/M40 family metallo-hydrolase [Bacteroidales bacterium]
MKKTFLFAVSLSAVVSAYAQNNFGKEISIINKDNAKAHIGFLASDFLKGRDAGSESNYIAGEYIVSQLMQEGIEPFNESYFIPFDAIVIPKKEGRPEYVIDRERIIKEKTESVKQLKMRNIIAKIDGENPNEFVVIGAHYDHLGIGEAVGNDSIFNGADDNASGVSAVLQIAKAIKQKGVKPKRTIVFAFWDGEERGLLGSKRFVEDFKDRDKIKGYLNFDMIGRNNNEEKPKHVVYFYTQAYPQFGDWMKLQVANNDIDLQPDLRPWDKPVGGSDNASFAKHNIPIIWYHTDAHPDYHKVGDHSGKINYDKVVQISRSACENIWNLANQDY